MSSEQTELVDDATDVEVSPVGWHFKAVLLLVGFLVAGLLIIGLLGYLRLGALRTAQASELEQLEQLTRSARAISEKVEKLSAASAAFADGATTLGRDAAPDASSGGSVAPGGRLFSEGQWYRALSEMAVVDLADPSGFSLNWPYDGARTWMASHPQMVVGDPSVPEPLNHVAFVSGRDVRVDATFGVGYRFCIDNSGCQGAVLEQPASLAVYPTISKFRVSFDLDFLADDAEPVSLVRIWNDKEE